MNKKKLSLPSLVIPVFTTLATAQATESDSRLLDMEFEELLQTPYVSIASGSLTPVQKAAAVATVITAEDIRAMGATDLDQVLESVPGLHVSNTFSNYNPIYSFRGLYSEVNPQTLVLINGIPITSLYRGDRGAIWGGMPVRAIARIEIIRGPGSAIYGADAFAGVINIITKTAQDIPEQEVGIGYGSFNTKEAWLLSATDWQGTEITFTAEFQDTDGARETIDIDQQSLLDQATGTQASNAPGPTELSRRATDFRLDIHRNEWRFRAGYQGRDNVGNGAGFNEALDPSGRYESTRYNADLQYHQPKLSEHWELTTTLSFLHIDQQSESDTYLLPKGSSFPIAPMFNLPLPDGLIGNPEVWENNYRADAYAFYTGFDKHRIRLGTGYYYGHIYQVRETKNFDLAFNIYPNVVDFSDTDQVFLPEGTRENVYASVQDEWQFHENWNLTTGLRFDHYSDFGDTLNPRVALIWDTTERVTTRFLVGRAFRAPSFSELYSKNPVAAGTPDLKPETINTYEIAVGFRATDRLHLDVNVFQFNAHDLILYQPGGSQLAARNSGTQEGRGAEIEARYQVIDDLKLVANYAYQHSNNKSGEGEIGNSPNHEIYLRSEWEFVPEWNFNTQVTYVGKIKRPANDDRPALDAYALVDLILMKRNVVNKLDASFVVRNLLDEDVREPASPNIPNDLPMPGISFYGALSYRF